MVTYVTGSSGFLGSNLLKALKEAGDKVETIPHKEISTIKLKPYDKFYFLSAYGNMSFHTDSKKIIKANVLDLISVLDQVRPETLKSFVFISTSSTKLPVQTMYSRTKRAAEEMLLAYKEKYNWPICVIQPYSITGVGEQKEHLIPTLINSCFTGELVNFVSDPVHDFIDVEDVVAGIMNLSKYMAKGIFELGSGKKYMNREVLNLVEKVTGKKARINTIDQMRLYDNRHWVSNNFKARGFGWLPRKTLEQSITEMVKEYEQTKEKDS